MCKCQDNNCGCSKTTVEYKKCKCAPETPCDCPVRDLSTNCSVYQGDNLECSGIVKGTILTELIQQLDAFICAVRDQLINSLSLINIGTGAKIYKGVDGIGRKEIRTIISSDSSVIVEEDPNSIDLKIIIPEPELQGLQSVLDTDPYAEIIDDDNFTSYNLNSFVFEVLTRGLNISDQPINTLIEQSKQHVIIRSVLNNGTEEAPVFVQQGDFTLTEGEWFINQTGVLGSTSLQAETPLVSTIILVPAKSVPGTYRLATEDMIPIITGNETKIVNGNNTTVFGSGTVGSPYYIDVPTPITPDGSETKLINGVTTSVTGNGTIATPYKVETVNLQKAITANYLLTSADNNYSIKINNGATPITITVPSGLPENFFAGFTQKGTADVTFVGSGTTITNPIGLKIKGQGYCVGLEQIGTSNSYDLLADTKS